MRTVCTALLILMLCNGIAWADRLAVVDVERIFRESTPGKAGEAHLEKVRDVLQKGMDEFIALYRGREETEEAQVALREVAATLERQFAAERMGVRQVLTVHLEEIVRTWFVANTQRTAPRAVAPANIFFAFNPDMDITDIIMREMNKVKPTFSDLPTVTVQPNPPATPGTGRSATPARQPARSRAQ